MNHKENMSVHDMAERDTQYIEGEVRSSAELLRRFQIKREKVLGKRKAVVIEAQGADYKKEKPPTTALITSKSKGFDNRIRDHFQGTFSIANHSTSDQGQGKNVSEKKLQIEAANMKNKKSQIQCTFCIANHSTSNQGQGKNVTEKKLQIEAVNMQNKKSQIQVPMKLSLDAANKQNKKVQIKDPMKSSTKAANMQSKKTQIQDPKRFPTEAANTQGKRTQIQDPKKLSTEGTNKRKSDEHVGSHGRQPIERVIVKSNDLQENDVTKTTVAEHSGLNGRQPPTKVGVFENKDSHENLQIPQKMTRKVPMYPTMLIDQFLQENVEVEEEEDASEYEEFMEEYGEEEENALEEGGCEKLDSPKKKTRGPTRCLKIHARSFEERQEVTLDDDGEPIGPKDQVVSDLSYFLGTVANNPNFCPLIYTNFKGLTEDERERIWDFVNEKFIIPEKGKKAIFSRINDAWRRYKNYIKRNYFLKYSTLRERLKYRPNNIPENQYRHLMVYWKNNIVQNISQKNDINRAKQKYIHHMGPINFARIRAKLQEKKNGEEASQAEMFIQTRQSRKGKEVDKDTQIVITKLQESIESPSCESAEQVFQSIFGKEKPGRVRCLGRTITPSMLKKNEEIVALKKQHSAEIGSMAKKVQGLQGLVRCLLKEINPGLDDQALDNIMENAKVMKIVQHLLLLLQPIFQVMIRLEDDEDQTYGNAEVE